MRAAIEPGEYRTLAGAEAQAVSSRQDARRRRKERNDLVNLIGLIGGTPDHRRES
jgi:hypothetical protein